MKLFLLSFYAVLIPVGFIIAPALLFAEESVVPSGSAIRVNMAVADFTGLNVSPAESSIVAGFLRTELVNLPAVSIMARDNMDAILSEQKLQASGLTDPERAVQIGKLLNVQQLVIGSLSKLSEAYYITVNVVDVETGKIIVAYTQEAASPADFRKACGVLAQNIYSVATTPLQLRQEVIADRLRVNKSSTPGYWAFGLVYPGAAIKYRTGGKTAWELKGEFGADVFAGGPRYYHYFNTGSALSLFCGAEADYIRFKGKISKGTGFAGGVFAGGEMTLNKRIGLSMDFGPMYVTLEDDKYLAAVSGVGYIVNMAVYWYFK